MAVHRRDGAAHRADVPRRAGATARGFAARRRGRAPYAGLLGGTRRMVAAAAAWLAPGPRAYAGPLPVAGVGPCRPGQLDRRPRDHGRCVPAGRLAVTPERF